MIRCVSFIAAIFFATPLCSFAADEILSTVAERSGFQTTGRYEEVIKLCGAFQKAYPKWVRCQAFGRTLEGRPMLALVATRTGVFTGTAAKQRAIPVLLVQGGIRAGEIDGKDAGFLALREVLDNQRANGALDKQILVFVPVFNVDGHERFGKWNRPNQTGPEEMGWRTTAQNFNLNRDYAKADSAEMQAMLRLINAWDPIATIDLHVTDGAKFEHDIAITVEPGHGGDAALAKAGRIFRDLVIADLAKAGSLPLAFYPEFNVADDPSSGITDGVSPPRFSSGYFLTRNRFAMLVETHSWKDYPTRVRIARNTVISVLNLTALYGRDWLKTVREADARAALVAGQPVTLTWKAGEKNRRFDYRGYEYTRTMSEVSGALMTRYDDSRPQIWKLTIRDDVQPDLTIVAPRGGYVVPVAHANWIAEKLSSHGISFRKLTMPAANISAETFRAEKTTFGTSSIEGHQMLSVTGEWKAEMRNIELGSLFVPIAQPKSLLVMSLFEPLAPDSFLAWGFFNNAFEPKEAMENYVAEAVARAQMAADPALAAEFSQRLATDSEFSNSPAARLNFFARRHASWDERFNLYPVTRVSTAPK